MYSIWIYLSFDILGFHILIIFSLALARNREKRFRPEPVLVNLLRSPGIDSNLSYRPARLHRLAESIPGLLERLQIRALVVRFIVSICSKSNFCS